MGPRRCNDRAATILRDDLRGRKILFVFGTLTMGAAERQATLLARDLRQRAGAAVEVWGYVTYANLVCGLTWRASGARVCVWNQRGEVRLSRRGERLAARLTPLFI